MKAKTPEAEKEIEYRESTQRSERDDQSQRL